MKVIHVPVGEKPRVTEINGSLESMQRLVDGYIQVSYILPEKYKTVIIVNEEGKMDGSAFNRVIYDNDDNDDNVLDFIFGDFFLCGVGSDDFTDIDDKYIDMFTDMFEKLEVVIDYAE